MSNKLWDTLGRLQHSQNWMQGDLHDERTGRRCVLGAYANVQRCERVMSSQIVDRVADDPEIHYLADAIREHFADLFKRWSWVAVTDAEICMNFNDADGIKHKDVVLVLEKAAIKMDEVL